MTCIGRGATGTIYQLNDTIVVKRARRGIDEEADHANEQKMFGIIQKHPPIQYLIQCYYHTPGNTFLEFAPNGSVAMLLDRCQQRNGNQVVKVLQHIDAHDVRRWMKQLCLAVAGLERIGIVHGDIRPGNILLDADHNLKLSDLDRGMMIGDDIAVLSEPYGRLLDEEDGEEAGSYGRAGPRTETFAIGSVYYTLLRGHEPHEMEDWGGNHFVVLTEKFQRKQFPPLADSAADRVIRKCWNGEYSTIGELLAVFESDSDLKEAAQGSRICSEAGIEQRLACEAFVRNGTVDSLERY